MADGFASSKEWRDFLLAKYPREAEDVRRFPLPVFGFDELAEYFVEQDRILGYTLHPDYDPTKGPSLVAYQWGLFKEVHGLPTKQSDVTEDTYNGVSGLSGWRDEFQQFVDEDMAELRRKSEEAAAEQLPAIQE